MPIICLQAGHVNIQYNASPDLRSATGSPGEAGFTLDIANKVSTKLRTLGFTVQQTDANANSDPAVTGRDWDLFLAIHWDADVYGRGGGFVGAPDPSIDYSSAESLRLANEIWAGYQATTGVVSYPQRQNPNTKYYYMWNSLSAKTPCVLIECGVGNHRPDDFELLNNNRPRVVEGLCRGICNAFGVPYPAQPQTNTSTIKQVHDILYGRGTSWSKYVKLRQLIPA